MKFKEVLRDLRKRSGLTQEELATKAGVPVTSLRGHEQGQRVPSWASIVKLAKALGISTDVFANCDEVQEEQAESHPPAPRGRPRKADAGQTDAPPAKKGKKK
jgi:transcriptional regulator with XRE-family HTH domain